MKFIDYNKFLLKTISWDDIKEFSDEFHITQKSFLPFRPVINNSDNKIINSFIGLNAYSSLSYLESIKDKSENFTELVQTEYNSKIYSVIILYENGLRQDNCSYFTDFIKIILPEDFSGEHNVINVINKSKNLHHLFLSLLKEEVLLLMKYGCENFVFFGEQVWNQAIILYFLLIDSKIIKFIDSDYNYIEFLYNEKRISFIWENHYSRYKIEYTNKIIQMLQNKIV